MRTNNISTENLPANLTDLLHGIVAAGARNIRVGRTTRMTGDYLDSVQDATLSWHDEDGEHYYVGNETMPGGLVVEHADGRRLVDLGVCWLDADSGEEISY